MQKWLRHRQNDFICYGRQGEPATNSREQQEIVTLLLLTTSARTR